MYDLSFYLKVLADLYIYFSASCKLKLVKMTKFFLTLSVLSFIFRFQIRSLLPFWKGGGGAGLFACKYRKAMTEKCRELVQD